MTNAEHNASAKDMTASPQRAPDEGSENCLPIGTRVGEFEITGVVGEGGFGTVYLAFDHSLQRTVALKEYLPPALASRGPDTNVVVRSKRHQETFEAGLKSFINEARLLAQFDHPALIKVYRFWEQNGTAYMAMRYYEGKTLKELLSDQPSIATETWWKSILKPILEALDVLYQAQILHRDISPENIMIQNNGEAVLLDFGAARQLISNMTQALTVILKPGYAPIEQYADDPSMKQGPWTDIYALSAVVYSTITNKTPPASVARMIKDPMEPLVGGSYPGFSKQFLLAIDKGLAVKPEDRPQTVKEFGKLLGLKSRPSGQSGTSSSTSAAAPVSEDKKPDQVLSGSDAPAVPKDTTPAAKTAKVSAALEDMPVTKEAKPASTKWLLGIAATVCAAGVGFYAVKDKSADIPVPTSPAPAASASASKATPAAGTTAPAPAAAGAASTGTTAAVSATPTTAAPVSAKPASTPDEEIVSWDTIKKESQAKPAAGTSVAAAVAPDAAKSNAPAAGTQADKNTQAAANTPKPASKDTSKEAPTPPKAVAGNQPDTKASDKPVEKKSGSIQLGIKPWGNILVDGAAKGVSPPMKRLTLTEGKHQIRVVNPNFPDYVVDITVSDQKTVRIDHDFAQRKR